MTYSDAIYDAIFFAVALLVTIFFLVILLPYQSENVIEGEVKQDLTYMQVQEFTLAFMKNYDEEKGDTTMFTMLSDYYSQRSQATVYIDGNGYPKEDILDELRNSIAVMTRPGNWYLRHIRPEGSEFDDNRDSKYGLKLPVPTSQGEVKTVWAWQ